MTKKEKAYIQQRAKQFFKWYEEEKEEAQRTKDPEEKGEHYHQADLNYTAYNFYDDLIRELEEL